MKIFKSNKIRLCIYPLFLSGIITLLLLENYGHRLENKLRYTLYDFFLDSFPNFAPNFVDSRGVPQTFYPEQNGIVAGWQYNGTIVANYAIEYFNRLKEQPDKETRNQFYACIHWLDNNITEVNGKPLYLFTWQQPWYPQVKAPFTSGMTSGRAIEAFTYAFQLDGDSSHWYNASRLVAGFDLKVNDSGFTYKEPQGFWYEEIAGPHQETPRILDGHIFCLTGLWVYYRQSGDSLAKHYFDQGLAALKAALPAYDRGDGYVFYDKYKKLADESYHSLLVDQMETLFALTGDTLFRDYAQKWGKPIRRPYVFKMIRDANKSAGLVSLLLFLVIWVSIFHLFRYMAASRGQRVSSEKALNF